MLLTPLRKTMKITPQDDPGDRQEGRPFGVGERQPIPTPEKLQGIGAIASLVDQPFHLGVAVTETGPREIYGPPKPAIIIPPCEPTVRLLEIHLDLVGLSRELVLITQLVQVGRIRNQTVLERDGLVVDVVSTDSSVTSGVTPVLSRYAWLPTG